MGYMFSLLPGQGHQILQPLRHLFTDPFLIFSRPDLIDSALLRPGRLDKSLLCNMPTKEERREVRQALYPLSLCDAHSRRPADPRYQILQAHARKVPMSPDVDFDRLADATEGFSGADLQALLYNAHLEVVHASVGASAPTTESSSSKDRIDDAPIEYTLFGGPAQKTVASRAEQMATQRRVRCATKQTSPFDSNRFADISYARSCLRRRAAAPVPARTRWPSVHR
jgi:peroxin-1